MELVAFLELLSTWLAGVVAWWLIDHIAWFAGLQPDTKRYAAYGFSFVIACLAWLALVAVGARSVPVSVVEWINQLFMVGTSSFGLATLLNGPSLRKYRTD
jgi:drug/metabolite transporter superfamily protein YnfA